MEHDGILRVSATVAERFVDCVPVLATPENGMFL